MTPEQEGSGAFRPGKPGLRKLLGDLEADIMEIVWSRGGAAVTVREVFEVLLPLRDPAYTTVMTVMGHLARKGVLIADKAGKAHLYRASATREAFTDAAVARIVDELMRDFYGPAIAHFARAMKTGEDK